MEDEDKACTLSLSLELGLGGGYVPKKEKQQVNKPVASSDLTLEAIDVDHDDMAKGFSLKRSVHEERQLSNEKSTNNTTNKARAKKLRLTKEQSDMLEDTFMLHNTINPAQKRALAEQLNLKHRQVEVWFQNRRARTKLKQTEVNCAFLQKCHEKLTEENLRLKKELEELRALKLVGPSPPYTQPSKAANWTVCSSCKKVLLKPSEGNNAAIFDVVQKSSH